MAGITQTDIAVSTANASSYNFTAAGEGALDIGANGGNDIIYISPGSRTTSGAEVATCTVDGVAPDKIAEIFYDESGDIHSLDALFAMERNDLPDPDQTDIDVVITYDATCLRCAVAVSVSPDASKVATDTATLVGTQSDLSLDTPQGGIVVASCYDGNGGPMSWTGLTEESDINVEGSGNQFTTAYASAATAETPRTVSVTPDAGGALNAAVAASFAVAVAAAGARATGSGLTESRLLERTRLAA